MCTLGIANSNTRVPVTHRDDTDWIPGSQLCSEMLYSCRHLGSKLADKGYLFNISHKEIINTVPLKKQLWQSQRVNRRWKNEDGRLSNSTRVKKVVGAKRLGTRWLFSLLKVRELLNEQNLVTTAKPSTHKGYSFGNDFKPLPHLESGESAQSVYHGWIRLQTRATNWVEASVINKLWSRWEWAIDWEKSEKNKSKDSSILLSPAFVSQKLLSQLV